MIVASSNMQSVIQCKIRGGGEGGCCLLSVAMYILCLLVYKPTTTSKAYNKACL